jgi:hypothetical protein
VAVVVSADDDTHVFSSALPGLRRRPTTTSCTIWDLLEVEVVGCV